MIWRNFPAFLIGTVLATLTCLPSFPARAATANPPSAELISEHLGVLEEALAEGRALVAGPGFDRRETPGGFLAHLRLLEPLIAALDQDQAAALGRRLDVLRQKARELTAAAEEPATESPGSPAEPAMAPARSSARSEGPAPINDDCGSAIAIGNGAFTGDLAGATQDGLSSCDVAPQVHDVWYRYTAPADGVMSAYLEGSSTYDVVSIHAVCPGTTLSEITCNHHFEAVAGQEFLIRVAKDSQTPFTLRVIPASIITGTVTDAVTGQPLSAIVDLSDPQGVEIGGAAADGTYRLPVTVAPNQTATYLLYTRATPDHVDEYYDDAVCVDEYCLMIPAGTTPVVVGSSVTVAGIDFALDRLGAISGTVTDELTGQPAPFARVSTRDENWSLSGSDTTDGSGNYTVEKLPAGDHFVIAGGSDYLDEVYDDIPCPDASSGDCDPAAATLIPAELNATTTGIDFALRPLGSIAGTVTHAASGDPIPLVDVFIFNADGSFADYDITDAAGTYAIGGLDPGSYFAITQSYADFADELYNGRPCPRATGCDPTTGDPIAVSFSAVTAGIDFALDIGGRIEGTVVATVDGEPIPSATVSVWNGGGSIVTFTSTNADGHYSVSGLSAGAYRVTAGRSGHLAELFDEIPCSGGISSSCDLTAGAPVGVITETTTSGVDFSLDRLGTITGTLTDQATGEPIPFATLEAWNSAGDRGAFGHSDLEGHYVVSLQESGSYFLTVDAYGYFAELFDDLPCPGGGSEGCDPTTGTPIAIALNTTVSGIDFTLAPQPVTAISGTVRDESTGEPLGSTSVTIWDETGSRVDSSSAGFEGTYQVSDLTPGTYFVTARNFNGYISELHDDLPCPDAACDPTVGNPVTVEDSVTTNVDFALTRRGVITGAVRDSLIGDPIQRLNVRVWDTGGGFVDSDSTDSTGSYTVEDLSPGTYFVSTLNSDGFLNQLYAGIPCPVGACDPTVGTPVQVDLNTITSGVDFVLDLQQGISGRVTRDFNGLPFPFAYVNIWNSDGNKVESVHSGPTGEYLVGLPLGTYFASTDVWGFPGVLADVLYDGFACQQSDCGDPTRGTPVTVTGGNVVQGIDLAVPAEPPACVPSATRLCLLEGRFQVEVGWQDFDGNAGDGQAAQLTDATGTFWFFAPDNIEMVVKVLDACYQPFDHYWVFGASLTNAQVELTVTDLHTGQTRTYFNPLGNPAEPIQDTSAFATCPVPQQGSSSSPADAALARRTRQEVELALARLRAGEDFRSPVPHPVPSGDPLKQGSCTPSATRLCVEDGRFQVETLWQTPDGTEGMGQAVPLSAATGYFWFFSPENVEAVVKVLNACDLASFGNYWVFAAGLTDIEVLIRVTDTISGQVREYTNPQQTPFQPIQDTDAFRACP